MYSDKEILRELKGSVKLPKTFLENVSLTDTQKKSYFSSKFDEIKLDYWNNYVSLHNKGNSHKGYWETQINKNLNKGYNKMIFTKYFTTSMDKIPTGSVGYFIGKRFSKVKVINDTLKHYGLTWERKDPSLADFFIVGNDLTKEEMNLNPKFSKPMVMDDELRVDHHFSVLKKGTVTSINEEKLITLFSKATYDNLYLISNLMVNVTRDALSDKFKFKLLRLYVKVFTDSSFDLSNKDHVFISDSVQKYCIPYLRYYVTKSYLTHANYQGITTNIVNDNHYEVGDLLLKSQTYDPDYNYFWLPIFEGSKDIYLSDIEESNYHSLVDSVNYSCINDHSRLTVQDSWKNENKCCINLSYGMSTTRFALNFTVILDKDGAKCYNLRSGKNYSMSSLFLNIKSVSEKKLTTEEFSLFKSKRDEVINLFDQALSHINLSINSSLDPKDIRDKLNRAPQIKKILVELEELQEEYSTEGTPEVRFIRELSTKKRIENLKLVIK